MLVFYIFIKKTNMLSYTIRFSFLLLISYNYVSGLSQLPLCQCECCPGKQCQSQLLIFSIDKCNKTTCSFEQCYKMYPKKCGLIPGITNVSCNIVSETTTTNLPNITIAFLRNSTSCHAILPIVTIINLLFVYLFQFVLKNSC